METQKTNFISENVNSLKDLCAKYNNNFELGEQVRKNFYSNTFVKSLPNDRDLGESIRMSLLKL